MNNISIRQKQLSSEALWEKIEEIYGVVPEIIRQVLRVNGFDSFLALKGIRYDDKVEFFDSLETTIREILTSEDINEEKLELQQLLRGYCDLTKFKLKPGHKNFIMNLMKEIDNSDPHEFFKSNPQIESPKQVTIVKVPTLSPTPVEVKYEIHNEINEQIDNNQYEYQQPHEQIYFEDQHTGEIVEQEIPEEEYLLEEYLSDDHRAMEGIDGYVVTLKTKEKRKKSVRRVHRKPERMYNEEFLKSHANPRKRRVTTSKFYPNSEEGTKERFRDLMKQSMECILTKEQFAPVENMPIDIEKQSDSCYSVLCPLCGASIKLAVVYENNGKYVNYKRSNFERHLRYKHCKTVRKIINDKRI